MVKYVTCTRATPRLHVRQPKHWKEKANLFATHVVA